MKKRNILICITILLLCGSFVFGQKAKPTPTQSRDLVKPSTTPKVKPGGKTLPPPVPTNNNKPSDVPITNSTKKRLAIIAFENRSRKWWTGEWDVGATLASLLAYQMANAKVYDLVDYTKEVSLTELQNKSLGGRYSKATAVEIGRLKSASVAAVGEVIDFDTISEESKDFLGRITNKKTGVVTIIVTLYDIKTGELVGSAKAKGTSPPQISKSGVGAGFFGIGKDGNTITTVNSQNWQQTFLNDAADASIKKIVDKLISYNETGEFGDKIPILDKQTEGMVANFDKKTRKVILNVSASDGVKVGDVFKITRQGKCTKDPVTGENLKCDQKEIAQIKILYADDKYSEGEVISGGDIKREDKAVKKVE